MAKILTEKRNIDNNVFEYEKRLQSPYNRFVDKFPTYVTYYHIDNNDTTVDEGYKDTEELIGPNSSLRFHKITDFPLYGISQMVLSLNEEDQGLDVGYEGECVFLPHTIKPLQNDYFIINHLNRHDSYLFRITGIEYDNIHPDNFYKATFKLDYTDYNTVTNLEKQITNDFICITDNVGTDEQCIIEASRYSKIREIKKIYEDIADTYMSIFYNERYNLLMGEKPCSRKLYDPYLIEFVNKHQLFNDKERLTTYIFGQEVEDRRFVIKYEKSVWRYIERNDITLLRPFYIYTYLGKTLSYSIFARWHDETVDVVDISLNMNTDEQCVPIFSDRFITSVKSDDTKDMSSYATLLRSYLRGEKLDVYSVPSDINTTLLSLDANIDFFYTTPMILYIIKKILHDELKINDPQVTQSVSI